MSRLLHTSDWHVGHTLHGHPRTEDFDAVLAEIVAIARETQPDLIVHSGDLFHSARPSPRDMLRALRTLAGLAAIAPTVVVAGNHDSPVFFDVFEVLTGPSVGRGLFFVGRYRPADEGGVFAFDGCGGQERIRLAALPFVHPNRFWQQSSSGPSYGDYAKGMRELQAGLVKAMREEYDPDRDVLFFTAHVYVTGADRSKSERAMDASFEIAAEDLPDVSYTALGHIHLPQAVRSGTLTARYAGSPLAMDFSEADQPKGVAIVDAEPGRPVRVRIRRLTSARRLARFEGTLDQLRAEAAEYDGTFLKPLISGEKPDVALHQKIAEIVPHAVIIKPALAEEAATDAVLDFDPGEEPQLPDAFRAYLAREGLTDADTQAAVTAFTQLLNEVDHEAPPPVLAHELLRAALDNPWTETS
ncbi:exonuclease SbcCD subunit D [Streptomyces sp. NPDC096068]|uniref:metallophosphoesterase family protein n=1 Tax=Streptomyces sp. NPDC096068 TaxID=3155424 RepID=UPI00332C4C23